MNYVDGFVAANRETDLKHATDTAARFEAHGALKVAERRVGTRHGLLIMSLTH